MICIISFSIKNESKHEDRLFVLNDSPKFTYEKYQTLKIQ